MAKLRYSTAGTHGETHGIRDNVQALEGIQPAFMRLMSWTMSTGAIF